MTPIFNPLKGLVKNTYSNAEALLKCLDAEAAQLAPSGEAFSVVHDQDFPTQFLGLQSGGPPLFVLGGMGPAAGLAALRYPVEKIQQQNLPSRSVYLLQLTQVPDRTEAVVADQGHEPGHAAEYNAVVETLRAGFAFADEALAEFASPIPTVVACNTAHYFLEDAMAGAPWGERFELISLIDTTVQALVAGAQRPLICATTGTRVSRLYSAGLEAADVDYVDPTDTQQEVLMRAIYEGVKGCNPPQAINWGTRFMQMVLADKKKPTAVLAGCTEIPDLLTLLRVSPNQEVADFVRKLPCINPMHLAMQRALELPTTPPIGSHA